MILQEGKLINIIYQGYIPTTRKFAKRKIKDTDKILPVYDLSFDLIPKVNMKEIVINLKNDLLLTDTLNGHMSISCSNKTYVSTTFDINVLISKLENPIKIRLQSSPLQERDGINISKFHYDIKNLKIEEVNII